MDERPVVRVIIFVSYLVQCTDSVNVSGKKKYRLRNLKYRCGTQKRDGGI